MANDSFIKKAIGADPPLGLELVWEKRMEKELLHKPGADSASLEAQADLLVEPSLDAMPQVLDYLESQCSRLTPGSGLVRVVNSAGAQAFCAACMTASKGLVSMDLTVRQGTLGLKVGFFGKCKARPYGLAPALFSPLGCKTQLEQAGHHWQWTASWEL